MTSDHYYDDPEEFYSESSVQNSSIKKKLILIPILIGILTLGNTLAANITLNSGANNEFGQGVQILSSCDSSFQVKPIAEYRNDAPAKDMYLTRFDIKDLSNRCADKLFVIKAYAETGTALSANSDFPFYSIRFHFNAGGWVSDGAGCIDFLNTQYSAGESNSASINLKSCSDFWNGTTDGMPDKPPLRSRDVRKFTVETKPYSIVKIDISTTANDSLGWIYTAEDEFTSSSIYNWNAYELHIDTQVNGSRFNIYGKISDSDYSNGAIGPNIYTLTASSGINCTYGGKAIGRSTINSGIFKNVSVPGNWKSVFYECVATSSGTVTLL
jgi:hypothetical protein